ncbi:CbtA family protein [Rhizobiaceae bacterium BDR2-2]|uniref:CbtA family protein n=1 Tax=Ectorhizobium quercum TaxID=2965071 RepID=A0AAE3SWI0_9HYPH|nr:CbtA family protein [Ectorhizobium quercum]MCX8998049.1 CbtA family protein [Ectorhizobium quercum]
MSLFRNVVFVAALVGLLSGLFLTLMQGAVTVPLILQAETFESGGEPAADTALAVPGPAGGHDHAEEEEDGWMPSDGFERYLYTGIANVLAGIGFALLLISASEAFGGLKGWRNGLHWGLAGFLVFSLVPGIGLAPELPGMPAAELFPRQVWWTATAAATAAALALLVFSRSPVLAAVALVLLVAPHLVGPPQPESHETLVPADVHQRFVAGVFATSLVFWATIGVLAALIRPRFRAGEDHLPETSARVPA